MLFYSRNEYLIISYFYNLNLQILEKKCCAQKKI